MGIDSQFWAGRKVFLTGHTGFKGGWLALWLARLGASVTGYALDPLSGPSLFSDARIGAHLEADIRADIRDRTALAKAMAACEPDVVLHLAAQAVVSKGYADPIGTYETNVIGTGNVLLSAFACPSVTTIISVASDKCYDNREWIHPYRETDRLGGKDPYSSSKGCAEILTASLRDSLRPKAKVASGRAGNVIGGGDWAADRIVPDCVRAFSAGEPVELRRPQSVRPWQFVLEPLSGYLQLAQKLAGSQDHALEGGWNFGPVPGGEATVLEVASSMARLWGDGADLRVDTAGQVFEEASLLRLDSTKARVALGWKPVLDTEQCLSWTAAWYDAWRKGEDLQAVTLAQIDAYMERLQ